MDGYVAKRVDDKIPLPAPVSHHPRFKTKFRETTRFYQLALFLIPLGTLFIAIGVFVPRWMDVQVVSFVTLKADYSIGLWTKCDTLKEKCTERLDSTLKGASGSSVTDCACFNCSFLLNPWWCFVFHQKIVSLNHNFVYCTNVSLLSITYYKGRGFDRLAVEMQAMTSRFRPPLLPLAMQCLFFRKNA